MNPIPSHPASVARLSLLFLLALAPADSALSATPENYDFPTPLSSRLPTDVRDVSEVRRLSAGGKIPEAQRIFDIFSWQMFIALNWAAQADGAPDPTRKPGAPDAPLVWEFYREARTVFKDDGSRPDEWGKTGDWDRSAAAATARSAPSRRLWMTTIGDLNNERTANRTVPRPRLDESLQAFTGPLIDQNGKWVRYEVVINKTEFDYLYKHELYNLDGQIAFTAHSKIDFPANDGAKSPGSMELKFAWKQLGEQDDPARFLVRRADIVRYDLDASGAYVETLQKDVPVGLVGMHIAVRTQSSPSWVWATFEQVDNTNANALERTPHGASRRPNFSNPDLPTKLVNELPPKNAVPDKTGAFTTWAESLTTEPTQVLQVLPIPAATAALNRQVAALLREQGSALQYYELIGTQWPLEPDYPAFSGGMAFGTQLSSSPESIIYKVPGKIVPVYLVNTTMETYFQAGTQPAGPLAWDDRLPAGVVADPTPVFGTESCVGCHFSAGAAIGWKRNNNGRLIDREGLPIVDPVKQQRVPVFGQNAVRGRNGDANYSWLLQMRAHAKAPSVSPGK